MNTSIEPSPREEEGVKIQKCSSLFCSFLVLMFSCCFFVSSYFSISFSTCYCFLHMCDDQSQIFLPTWASLRWSCQATLGGAPRGAKSNST